MDTNEYLVPKNSPKSYLRGGRTTRDTDEYLVLKNYLKSYLRGGWTTTYTDGYLALNNYPKVLPTEWMDDHRYRRVLGPQKIILNPVGRTCKMKY